MPIQFRCSHCNQLLGIARRKAGAVVDCPTCGRRVIVPRPDEPEEVPAEKPPPLLEMHNFSMLLKPPVPGRAIASSGQEDVFPMGVRDRPGNAPLGAGQARAPDQPSPSPRLSSRELEAARASSADLSAGGPPSMSGFMRTRSPGIWLSPAKATFLGILVVLLMTAAFLAGFILGRSSGRTSNTSGAPSVRMAQ